MLKVNVGLSRKLSQDFNSTGFSINLEGEVAAPLNDAESVVNGIKELYDLAEEALDLQVERFRSDSAFASREHPAHQIPARTNGNASNGRQASNGNSPRNGSDRAVHHQGHANGNRPANGTNQEATQKQINYLLTLAKRHRLSTMALEQRIQEVLGDAVGIYQLTKREAARVIDDLMGKDAATPR